MLSGILLERLECARKSSSLAFDAQEIQLEHSAIDSVLCPRKATVIHRNAVVARSFLTGCGNTLQLDQTIVRKLHKRSNKSPVGHRAFVHKRREHGRVVVAWNITEIRLVKRGDGALEAQFLYHRHRQQRHGNNDRQCRQAIREKPRTFATSICLFGPLLFLVQNIRKALFVRSRARWHAGHPRRGERDARLGKLARPHARNIVVDLAVLVVGRDCRR